MYVSLNKEEVKEAIALYLREKKLSHNNHHEITEITLNEHDASAEVSSSSLISKTPVVPAPPPVY